MLVLARFAVPECAPSARSEPVHEPLDALERAPPEVEGDGTSQQLEVPRDRVEVRNPIRIRDGLLRVAWRASTGVPSRPARARPGSTGVPQRGQSPTTVTDEGDRNRSHVVHQGTSPFQQGCRSTSSSDPALAASSPFLGRSWAVGRSRSSPPPADTLDQAGGTSMCVNDPRTRRSSQCGSIPPPSMSPSGVSCATPLPGSST